MQTKGRTAQGGFFNARVLLALLVCAAAACSMVSGALLGFFRSEAPAKISQRTLTFQDRVAYQRAIEEVYWRHRIWPKERPDPKPSLDAVMSQAQLENKVTDYLRKSQALEDYWQRPITGEQLQAEMDRMATHTKQPEVLRELFAALGDDPFVIAECLARPVLAQHLVTELNNEERAKLTTNAWLKRPLRPSAATVETQALVTMAAQNANYTLPAISSPSAACIDDWTSTSITNAPEGRQAHTAVWTGSEMIVWGGYSGSNSLNTGGRYNPSTDSWTATSGTNAPSGRYRHSAVWIGSEMIVWGGFAGNFPTNTGGRYDVSTDSWTATSGTNAPSARAVHTAVWTGNEMIVWGGYDGSYLNTGGRYNPSTNSWTATSIINAPQARYGHSAVWSGSEMIVWGGYDGAFSNTGARYNPTTDSWTATSTTNAPSSRASHTAVWTGSEMIVWGGGSDYPTVFNTGGTYHPDTDSWTATTTSFAPVARNFHTAVWTGSEMIIWGGSDPFFLLDTGGRYNPSNDSWTATNTTNAPTARYYHTAEWTGSEMIVWGGEVTATPTARPQVAHKPSLVSNTGGRYCTQSGPTPTPTATVTPTASPTCTPGSQYVISQIGGSIVPGATDIGNHCDDCVTTISLPFPFTLYDQTFTSINLSSNGNAQFTTTDPAFAHVCLPWTGHDYTILPYWANVLTSQGQGCSAYPGGTCGIYTSVSGTAPNRIFNIEWRAIPQLLKPQQAHFELRLYEGQTQFVVVYGTVDQGNFSATAGVQKDTAPNFTQYFCNGSGGPPSGGQSYTLQGCGTPTPTPTATATVTATATAAATPTATSTARPSPTPRTEPSPRGRPTPPPRP